MAFVSGHPNRLGIGVGIETNMRSARGRNYDLFPLQGRK